MIILLYDLWSQLPSDFINEEAAWGDDGVMEIEPSSSDGQVESRSQENQDCSTSRDSPACSIHLSEWCKVSLDLVLQPGSCLLCSSLTIHVFVSASFSSEATWLPSQLGCWMMEGWWCHPTTTSMSSSTSSWLLCVCVCMCVHVCVCTCYISSTKAHIQPAE